MSVFSDAVVEIEEIECNLNELAGRVPEKEWEHIKRIQQKLVDVRKSIDENRYITQQNPLTKQGVYNGRKIET